MMRLFFVLSCIVVIVSSDGSSTQHPELTTLNGRIRGSVMKSRLGRDIYAFRGIRYGQPPVGQLRFQVAIPVEEWKGVFDATQEGPGCPNLNELPVSEDCLRLNVYTTKLPGNGENVTRPVLVFFHPGGFYVFSAQSSNFGPEYLMDQDIVLVTINYRLGTLGFISTGDSLAPGNLGLKDQVIALRWIQRNIAAFGGDPNSVTISGYSVGGLSVMLHMVSPMSKGLFHRAISMSGSTLTTEPFPTEQKHLAKKQAELLGCPTDATGSMLICLNSKPMESFRNTMSQFFEWNGDPIIIWKPVVEPEVNGVERFLPAQPLDLIRQGKFHQVPLICGVTKDEFGGAVVAFDADAQNGNGSMYREMDQDWERLAPISFIYERDTERSKQISQELRRFYFGSRPINTNNSKGLANIYADSVIIFPTYRMARLIAENSRCPVYLYKFSYQGRYSFVMSNGRPYGVVHHDDLQYLFFIKVRFPFFDNNAPEVAMIERYTSMWSSFVKTGEPIPTDNELFRNVTWRRFLPAEDNYLNITLQSTMATGFFTDRMQEWERLFPLPPVSSCQSCNNGK